MLDCIQDPGNLGTILRSLDYFGYDTVYCSSNSVDVYNQKVVQSSMGSVGRMTVHYVSMNEFLDDVSSRDIPVYAADMKGKAITRVDRLKYNEDVGFRLTVVGQSAPPVAIPMF